MKSKTRNPRSAMDDGSAMRARFALNPYEMWLLIGLLGLNIYMALPMSVSPIQTGALIDGIKLSTTQAGVIGAIEGMVFSLVLIGLPRLPCRYGTRTLGLVGLAAALVGNIASSFSDDLIVMCVCRSFVAAGAGLVALASFAALATSARVDRMSAAITVATTIVGMAVVMLAGHFTDQGGYRALFCYLAGLAAVCAAISAGLPERRHEAGPSLHFTAAARSPLVIGAAAYMFAGSAVWTFSERIGLQAGLSVAQVGQAIGATMLAGLFAGVAALVLAKPGREHGFAILGMVCFGVGCAMLILATGVAMYIASLIVMMFFFVFIGPFFTALAVDVDRTGGLAAAMMGWATLVGAAAPAVAGVVVEDGRLDRLVWLVLAATSVGVVVLARCKPPARKPAG